MNDQEWYYTRGEEQCGPILQHDLCALLQRGEVQPDEFVWVDGMADWQAAQDVPALWETAAVSGGSAIHPLAIASLITGLLSFPFMGTLLFSIIAVVTGHKARARIKQEPERFHGSGLAMIGLICGYGTLLFTIIIFSLMAIAFATQGVAP